MPSRPIRLRFGPRRVAATCVYIRATINRKIQRAAGKCQEALFMLFALSTKAFALWAEICRRRYIPGYHQRQARPGSTWVANFLFFSGCKIWQKQMHFRPPIGWRV